MNVLFEIKSRDQSSVQINWLVSPVFQWHNLLIVVGSPYMEVKTALKMPAEEAIY